MASVQRGARGMYPRASDSNANVLGVEPRHLGVGRQEDASVGVHRIGFRSSLVRRLREATKRTKGMVTEP